MCGAGSLNADLNLALQELAPAEGAEAFIFKARPVPDLGVGQPAARAQRSQRRQTSSSIKPFQLSTEVCSPLFLTASCNGNHRQMPLQVNKFKL